MCALSAAAAKAAATPRWRRKREQQEGRQDREGSRGSIGTQQPRGAARAAASAIAARWVLAVSRPARRKAFLQASSAANGKEIGSHAASATDNILKPKTATPTAAEAAAEAAAGRHPRSFSLAKPAAPFELRKFSQINAVKTDPNNADLLLKTDSSNSSNTSSLASTSTNTSISINRRSKRACLARGLSPLFWASASVDRRRAAAPSANLKPLAAVVTPSAEKEGTPHPPSKTTLYSAADAADAARGRVSRLGRGRLRCSTEERRVRLVAALPVYLKLSLGPPSPLSFACLIHSYFAALTQRQAPSTTTSSRNSSNSTTEAATTESPTEAAATEAEEAAETSSRSSRTSSRTSSGSRSIREAHSGRWGGE
ncbi:hypothetical protein ACSSS7_005997 [Eimeria intestinalis]